MGIEDFGKQKTPIRRMLEGEDILASKDVPVNRMLSGGNVTPPDTPIKKMLRGR